MSQKNDALAAALSRAHELKPQLQKATEQLNNRIAEVEKALSELGMGVMARVVLEESDDDDPPLYLAFGKWVHSWRLQVVDPAAPDDDQFRLLNGESRARRIKAMKRLPELVIALTAAAEAEVEAVRETSQNVETLIRSLKGAQP